MDVADIQSSIDCIFLKDGFVLSLCNWLLVEYFIWRYQDFISATLVRQWPIGCLDNFERKSTSKSSWNWRAVVKRPGQTSHMTQRCPGSCSIPASKRVFPNFWAFSSWCLWRFPWSFVSKKKSKASGALVLSIYEISLFMPQADLQEFLWCLKHMFCLFNLG